MAAWWKTWRNAAVSMSLRCLGGKRTEGLLLEHEEDGVNELDVFDVVVDHVVGDKTLP